MLFYSLFEGKIGVPRKLSMLARLRAKVNKVVTECIHVVKVSVLVLLSLSRRLSALVLQRCTHEKQHQQLQESLEIHHR
jgi:hypothetical protein